jgi:hypothetical protein
VVGKFPFRVVTARAFLESSASATDSGNSFANLTTEQHARNSHNTAVISVKFPVAILEASHIRMVVGSGGKEDAMLFPGLG